MGVGGVCAQLKSEAEVEHSPAPHNHTEPLLKNHIGAKGNGAPVAAAYSCPPSSGC